MRDKPRYDGHRRNNTSQTSMRIIRRRRTRRRGTASLRGWLQSLGFTDVTEQAIDEWFRGYREGETE